MVSARASASQVVCCRDTHRKCGAATRCCHSLIDRQHAAGVRLHKQLHQLSCIHIDNIHSCMISPAALARSMQRQLQPKNSRARVHICTAIMMCAQVQAAVDTSFAHRQMSKHRVSLVVICTCAMSSSSLRWHTFAHWDGSATRPEVCSARTSSTTSFRPGARCCLAQPTLTARKPPW